MKRILGAIAVSAALLFSIAATPAKSDLPDANCVTTEDLVLHVEDFDESAFGNYEAELSGTLHNTSMDQGFDDVVVRVDYFDEQDVLIDSEMIKIHRDVDPGESESFSEDLEAPAEASRAEWSVDCAEEDRSFVDRLKFWRS